jgi:uncharacterized membrane protein
LADVAVNLRAEHRQETTSLQRAVDRLTAAVGWPGSVVVVVLAIGFWISANLLAMRFGLSPIDPPPFADLECALAASAVVIAAMILTTQRREDQLAGHRSQMILELAVLNDQKLSKIVELLEEGRRDNPALRNRSDLQAAAMSQPADTRAVLEAIKDVQGSEG